MNFKEYWQTLKVEIEKFDTNEQKNSNDTDETECKILRDTLYKAAQLGIDSQTYVPLYLGKLRDVNTLLTSTPFDKDGFLLNQIKGEKTRNFIYSVYLPHLQRFDSVEFGALLTRAATLNGEDIPSRKQHTKQKIESTIKLIGDYDSLKRPSMVSLTMFSTAVTPSLDPSTSTISAELKPQTLSQ